MTTLAKIGWGTTFSLADDLAVLTLLAEITGIGLPEDTVDTVEATHFGSAGARREFIAGLIDSGEGEMEMNYAAGSATDVLVRAAIAARANRAYKFVLPTAGGTWEVTGNCIPVFMSRAVPIDDRMVAMLRVKFTGVSSEAAGV